MEMHRRKEVPFLIGELGKFVEKWTDFQMSFLLDLVIVLFNCHANITHMDTFYLSLKYFSVIVLIQAA